ncbi:hypothetical protein BDV95DRAFT_503446 [Massariosphaeria phaeospora]|uniref:Uncharacterized protein n=1 Tax=Massariosphaeria phaeospora TaxID=100035 RepID=A0A7C8I8P0_9PLEO|nr:hypothetical protein BDV95DRAFT_503446 [Massariosphaeria phaeospora]
MNYTRESDKMGVQTSESPMPRLEIHIQGIPKLSLTLPYQIELTITRSPDDGTSKPVIFRWGPHSQGFVRSGFQLLHHTANGLEPLDIDHSMLVKLAEQVETMIVNGWNHFLWELSPGETTGKFITTLLARYQQLLVPGERYQIIWAETKITMWEWGTIRQHMNQQLKAKSEDSGPSLVLRSSGPGITFTARAEPKPWPQRAEREARIGFERANREEEQWRRAQNPPPRAPHIKPSDRKPGAPKLSVELECPPILHRKSIFDVAVKVTYDADAAAAKPMTFHTRSIAGHTDGFDFELYRFCGVDDWELCKDESDGCGGFRIVDDPDVAVNVGHDDHFVSLRPGESWSTSHHLQHLGWTNLPDDTADGERFRYVFTGTTVDWWDWGSKAEHGETVVKLPCWVSGLVQDPAHNDGRVKLIVPASEVVEFSVAE